MIVHPRSAWASVTPALPIERSARSILGVEFHWNGSRGDYADPGDTAVELEAFRRYHMNVKGWRDIFYNYCLDASGELWTCRPALTPSQSDLAQWVTVMVNLGPDDNPNPDVIRRGMAETIHYLRQFFPSIDSVRAHRERAATTCPGDLVFSIVEEIKEQGVANIEYNPWADASSDADAVAAEERGFWNGERPDEPVSRAEASIMINRAVEYVLDALPEGTVDTDTVVSAIVERLQNG